MRTFAPHLSSKAREGDPLPQSSQADAPSPDVRATWYAKCRKASAPIEGKWVVEWKTPVMPVAAFWTVDTEDEARQAVKQLIARRNGGELRAED